MNRGWRTSPGPQLGCSCSPLSPWPAVLGPTHQGRVGVISSQGPSLTDEPRAGPLPGRWPAQRDLAPGLGVPGSKPRALTCVSKPMGLSSESGGSSDVVTGEGRHGLVTASLDPY